MEKDPSQNQRNLRRLLMSVQASYGRLNLLIAICDNWKYRDELIGSYEKELAAKGTSCHRVRIERQQPSLKQCLQDLLSQEPALMSVDKPAIVTVLGADELLGIRLNEPKSAQEQFFFSAQWTREGLRDFKFPIVIWLTPDIATSLAQQAPDFWSWRGGVFEFSQSISASIEFLSATHKLNNQVESTKEEVVKVDPSDLQKQIDELLSQAPDSPLLASLYKSLGKAHKDAVRYTEVEEPYQKALELYEHQLGKEHSDVAFTLNELAELYKLQGKYSKAEPMYLRSLEILERQLGEDHLSVASSLNNLALLYESQGKYSEAEPLYLRSLEIRERQLGEDHSDVAQSLNNLALLYESQGKYSEAERMYLRSLEILERQLGEDHLLVANSLNNLAGLYKSQGQYSEAEPMYLRSLEIMERQLGADHPDVASSLNNLAGLYYSQGKYSEALKSIQRAIPIYEQKLGMEHPNTRTALSWLQVIREKGAKGKGKKGKEKKRGFGVPIR
jgi:tetratricopeptide (TPR) repeat protein